MEPIIPPADCPLGDPVQVEGFPPCTPCEVGNKAVKMFTKAAEFLSIDAQGRASYRGSPLKVAGADITSSILKGKVS